jgi:hypothetical protein
MSGVSRDASDDSVLMDSKPASTRRRCNSTEQNSPTRAFAHFSVDVHAKHMNFVLIFLCDPFYCSSFSAEHHVQAKTGFGQLVRCEAEPTKKLRHDLKDNRFSRHARARIRKFRPMTSWMMGPL